MSFHLQQPRTILVSHPRGPCETEMWRVYLVDKDAPDEVKSFLRSYYIRYSGPAGMTEQDDMENWSYATQASRGTIARRLSLSLQVRPRHRGGRRATSSPAASPSATPASRTRARSIAAGPSTWTPTIGARCDERRRAVAVAARLSQPHARGRGPLLRARPIFSTSGTTRRGSSSSPTDVDLLDADAQERAVGRARPRHHRRGRRRPGSRTTRRPWRNACSSSSPASIGPRSRCRASPISSPTSASPRPPTGSTRARR